jgi:ABC-2 type transport system permease protein
MSAVAGAEVRPVAARRPFGYGVGATLSVLKWELRKLVWQKRTYLGFGAAVLVPLAFVIALAFKSGSPNDVALGRYIRESGLATPFVVLEFLSIWGLPLITALVAGDIVAAESHNGTLKSILTRSRERGQIFAAKVLATITYTATVLFGMAAVALIAASIEWGFKPLTSLSGTQVSAMHGLGLLAATLGVYLLPLLGIAAFGLFLSTVTRNSAAAVVATLMYALLMQLLGALPGTEVIRPYLLGEQFMAWHGFLRVPIDWKPIVRDFWVCALYISIPLFAAYLVFLRRDVAD